MVRMGMVTFSPPGAWNGDMSDPSEETIKVGNDIILSMSDLIVARFIPGVASAGTDAELAFAASHAKPIVVVCASRDEISDAIAWASPIVGGSNRPQEVKVQYAFINDGGLEVVSEVSYDLLTEVSE